MSHAPVLHPITEKQRKEAYDTADILRNQRKDTYAAAEIFQNQRKETHAATDAFRDARANQLGRTDLLQQGLVRGEHSAVAGAASAADGSHRGVKRPQADTPDEIIDDRDLWRMRDNSVRLRGLLTNIEGTPDKRRFTLDLRNQIECLERDVQDGMLHNSCSHSDTRVCKGFEKLDLD